LTTPATVRATGIGVTLQCQFACCAAAANYMFPTARAGGPVMRAAFVAIQLLDGFTNTRDNVEGRRVEVFEGAGFAEVVQQQTFSAAFCTMALYRAVRSS